MSDEHLSRFRILDVGVLDYLSALKLQELSHHEVVRGLVAPTIIVVQHPPVLTLGKHADSGFLKLPVPEFKKLGVEVVQTDRGGEVTAHMPGQLVVYPIIKLVDFKLTPRTWVALLETAVIDTLALCGVSATTDPINPGVWVGSQKICAIGIRIKDRTSLHGLALNVSNDLDLFDKIIPCGIKNRGVTTLSGCVPKAPTLSEVASMLLDRLTKLLMSRVAR